jgi:hypothetical protein
MGCSSWRHWRACVIGARIAAVVQEQRSSVGEAGLRGAARGKPVVLGRGSPETRSRIAARSTKKAAVAVAAAAVEEGPVGRTYLETYLTTVDDGRTVERLAKSRATNPVAQVLQCVMRLEAIPTQHPAHRGHNGAGDPG